jgi:DNA-binding transcriptional LysR family regulator
MADLYDGLLNERYDAVFFSTLGREMLEQAGMKFQNLITSRPGIIFSKQHRLYNSKKELDIRDFANETIITLGKRLPYYRAFVEKICKNYGFDFNNIKQVETQQTRAFELIRGNGISFVDENYIYFENEEFQFFQLPDPEPGLSMGIGVAWSPNNTNPLLIQFLNCILENK